MEIELFGLILIIFVFICFCIQAYFYKCECPYCLGIKKYETKECLKLGGHIYNGSPAEGDRGGYGHCIRCGKIHPAYGSWSASRNTIFIEHFIEFGINKKMK